MAAFRCSDCGGPLDAHTRELVPDEAASGDAYCLRCWHKWNFGTEYPTQAQYDEVGWGPVEQWRDAPASAAS